MKLRRPKVINEMHDVNRELLNDGEDPEKILFYLVKHYAPTFWELRDALHPLINFTEEKPEERGLYAYRLTREGLRLFNKRRVLKQLIGTKREKIDVFKGKKTVKRTIWTLRIGLDDVAEQMQGRLRRERVGINDRLAALNDIQHNPTQYKLEADKLERSIEKRRRRGKSIKVSG